MMLLFIRKSHHYTKIYPASQVPRDLKGDAKSAKKMKRTASASKS
jgi:hypothetical protein